MLEPKHKVGDAVISTDWYYGIITEVTDTSHDPFNKWHYKVVWSFGEWWRHPEREIDLMKERIEYARTTKV